jgi:hypothetical protein
MAILSNTPLQIVHPELPYQRLAFRGSLSARIDNGVVTHAKLGLNITNYRKLDGEIEYLGSRGGSQAFSLETGTDRATTALLTRIAGNCAASVLSAPINASIVVNFNWRDHQGDILGLVQATVTPDKGEPINVASADVAHWNAEYPKFAYAYGDALMALAEWVAAKGV